QAATQKHFLAHSITRPAPCTPGVSRVSPNRRSRREYACARLGAVRSVQVFHDDNFVSRLVEKQLVCLRARQKCARPEQVTAAASVALKRSVGVTGGSKWQVAGAVAVTGIGYA